MVIITREIQNNFVELNLTRDDDHPSLTFLILLLVTTQNFGIFANQLGHTVSSAKVRCFNTAMNVDIQDDSNFLEAFTF